MTQTTQAGCGVTVTERAVSHVKALLAEHDEQLSLRLAARSGGCSLQYSLELVENGFSDDLTEDFDGLTLLVDRVSAPYLAGATIDYAELNGRSGFTIDNPNAGCGSCSDAAGCAG